MQTQEYLTGIFKSEDVQWSVMLRRRNIARQGDQHGVRLCSSTRASGDSRFSVALISRNIARQGDQPGVKLRSYTRECN